MAALSAMFELKQRLLFLQHFRLWQFNNSYTDFIWDTEVKNKRKTDYVTRKKVLKSCSYQAWPERCLSCVSV